MSETTNQPVIQVPAGVPTSPAPQPGTVSPGASQQAPGTGAPATPQSPGTTPSRARTKGIPAGPAALGAANTLAVAGSVAVNAYGAPGGIAVAAGVALTAAAMVGRKKQKTKTSAANRAARKAAQNRGMAYSPTGRSGSPNKSGKWSGSGSGRGPAGSGSSTGSIRRTSSGSNSGRPGPGTGRHRQVRSGSGSDRRIWGGSGRVKPGSGRTPAANQSGSGPGPGRSGGSQRQRVLRSSPTSTSLLRKAIGPRPGSGPTSRQGGLIRRGDGSKRQPLKAVKNGVRRVADRARKIARGAFRLYNSKAGKAARKWTVGAAKRAWKVGWPATASVVQGALSILRKQGWRAAWDVMKDTWRAKRNKNVNAPPTVIPAATVNMPANLVGATKPAGRGPTTNGSGITMAQARFIQAAAEMLGAATVYQPEGMMQVGNDFAQMPGAFRDVANSMKKMAETANDQWPLHPSIIDMMRSIYDQLQKAASLSEDLGPAFRNLHAVDIKRIENPRRGETLWDVGANQGY